MHEQPSLGGKEYRCSNNDSTAHSRQAALYFPTLSDSQPSRLPNSFRFDTCPTTTPNNALFQRQQQQQPSFHNVHLKQPVKAKEIKRDNRAAHK